MLGIFIHDQISGNRQYFFGALVGLFLYMSLGSIFPVLQDIIDEPPNIKNLSNAEYAKVARKQSLFRLVIANVRFLSSMLIVVSLVSKVFFVSKIQYQIRI